LRIDCITTEEELQRLQPEWNALLHRSRADTVFLTWEWLWTWWSSYKENKQLRVLVARDENGASQAIAPLYVEPHRLWGRTLRRLRLLGNGTYDSDYLDFIVPDDQEHLAQLLLDAMTERKDWDVAQLNEIPLTSPTVALLLDRFGGPQYYIDRVPVLCPAMTLPGTWDQYVASLRPRFRTAVRSALRNLTQLPGAIETLTDVRQLPEWLDGLFSLHGERWHRVQQSGVFATSKKREYYRALSQTLLQNGWLYFTRWRVQDAVLAYQFGFVYQGCYYQLQEGFDPASAHVAPGVTLRAAMIRDLIGAVIRKYDFLAGTGRHKTDWGACPAEGVRLAFAPRTAAGFAYVKLPLLLDPAKTRIKSWLPQAVLEAREGGDRVSIERSPVRQTEAARVRESGLKFVTASGALAVSRWLSRSYDVTRSSPLLLRKRETPKFAILSYHRVGTEGVPLYCRLDQRLFDEQMKYVRANYPVISMSQMYSELSCPSGKTIGVVVTFDDGYLGTYTEAFPVLKKYGIPATVYLLAGSIENGCVEWYDRIFLALQQFSESKLDLLLDRPRRFELNSAAARMQAAERIVSFLRTAPETKRVEICRCLEDQVQLPEQALEGRMMTWQQIREMQAAGMSFGAHTMSHRVLSRLAPEELRYELSASKALIEERIGNEAADFAYPFGKRADYGEVAQNLQRFGYRTAVTSEAGAVTPESSCYELRRMPTGGDESMAHFALKLNALFLQQPDDVPGPTTPSVAARVDERYDASPVEMHR
jgi:peptidoglycan/xylan/chitin deacetylase (PgdA/CDA1 family)/CelD/BcsL family acetyltransferase involved in cellulose biosynthesis